MALNKLWLLAGILFLSLGTVGILLPVLPTTPFLLLAAWCFANSSPRMHSWLLNNRLFGPIIKDWNDHKCIPLRTKLFALAMIIGFGGTSVFFFVPQGWPTVASAVLLLIGLTVVLRIKLCPQIDVSSGN